jgi:acyl carrier protein
VLEVRDAHHHAANRPGPGFVDLVAPLLAPTWHALDQPWRSAADHAPSLVRALAMFTAETHLDDALPEELLEEVTSLGDLAELVEIRGSSGGASWRASNLDPDAQPRPGSVMPFDEDGDAFCRELANRLALPLPARTHQHQPLPEEWDLDSLRRLELVVTIEEMAGAADIAPSPPVIETFGDAHQYYAALTARRRTQQRDAEVLPHRRSRRGG